MKKGFKNLCIPQELIEKTKTIMIWDNVYNNTTNMSKSPMEVIRKPYNNIHIYINQNFTTVSQ